MKNTMQFKIGDIVCYRSKFLRDIGWFTDVPINGKVTECEQLKEGRQKLLVEWCDDGIGAIQVMNGCLIHYDKRRFDV